ncbi:MAG: dihydroorotate dehydrogenase-like protein [Alphaproteobacteria bacterium]
MSLDLSTTYLGLDLKHPVIASASPLSATLEGVRALAYSGAAAIVLPSLFEEQIRLENDAFEFYMERGTHSFGEAMSYFPTPRPGGQAGPELYLELLRDSVSAVDVPIIASLNGVTREGWTDYACDLERAGAAAIELNIYYIPADAEESSTDVERRHLDIVHAVRGVVNLPIAVKMSPYFSATAHMAQQLIQAGANGLVLFNRFLQPDFDIEAVEVSSRLELSSNSEIRLPLTWIALLSERIDCSLGATRGVETHVEVIKYILAGADAVLTASALLRHGPGYITDLVDGVRDWMGRHKVDRLSAVKGSLNHANVTDPTMFERANYVRLLDSYHLTS